MKTLRYRISAATSSFWFLPALMVFLSVALAQFLIWVEVNYGVPSWAGFVYAGGESGARSLLSALTTASLGVAGTIFSITIAGLSSVISTMGPRLLHSFLKDRGIQATLGMFVSTFAFALYSLRSISSGAPGEGVFVPHLNVTGVMFYASGCVIFLVYYIGHMARSISMTRVVNLLADDLRDALERGTKEAEEQGDHQRLPADAFADAAPVRATKAGYVQYVDYAALVDRIDSLAEDDRSFAVDLGIRAGDMVVENMVIARARMHAPDEDTDDQRLEDLDLMSFVVIGNSRDDEQDLQFSVRQLLEIAVRALSSGTNDPFTAMDVTDRFAASLAGLRDRALPTGVIKRGHQVRLQHTVATFEGLVDMMFDQIRHNADGTFVVYEHLLTAYISVARVVRNEGRRAHLLFHAAQVRAEADRLIESVPERERIEQLYAEMVRVCDRAPEGREVPALVTDLPEQS